VEAILPKISPHHALISLAVKPRIVGSVRGKRRFEVPFLPHSSEGCAPGFSFERMRTIFLQLTHTSLDNPFGNRKIDSIALWPTQYSKDYGTDGLQFPDIDFSLTVTRKDNHNPARDIRGFELESSLIIISCSLKHIEKREIGLQVIRIY